MGFFTRFIEEQDTLERKLFWIVMLVCMATGLYSTVVTISERINLLACVVTSLTCVLFLVIMSIAHETKQYSICYLAMCLVLNCILIPADFFFCGGVMSGMPIYILMGTFLSSFCHTKRKVIIAVACSAVFGMGSIIVGLKIPSLVQNVTREYAYQDCLVSFVIVAAAIIAISLFVKNEYRHQRFREINNGIIDILGTVVEFRSIEAGDHIERIKGFTRILLSYVNKVYEDKHYSSSDIEVIASASAMHDIGKIAIPDSILLKNGPLTESERMIMQKHTVKGCEIIRSMKNLQDHAYYKYGYEICRHHHERYDGKGYPDGLKGEEIPLSAQVVALADVYDALVNERCYKPAYTFEQSYNMIMNGECGVFSPRLLKCLELAKKDMEICDMSMKQSKIFVNEEQVKISKKVELSENSLYL